MSANYWRSRFSALIFACIILFQLCKSSHAQNCSALPEVIFGTLVDFNGRPAVGPKNDTVLPLATTVYLRCDSGMVLRGDEISVCVDLNKWWPPIGYCVLDFLETPGRLFTAVENGNLSIIRDILEQKVQSAEERSFLVDYPDDFYGRTLLATAAANGSLNLVQYFVNKLNASVFVRDTLKGQLPIHIAAEGGFVDVVAFLAAAAPSCVNVRDNANNTALFVAAAAGRTAVVRFLVRNTTANVESRGELNRTPLMQAAALGYIDVVRVLTRQGNASVNATDNDRTRSLAIHLAAETGQTDVVRYFVKNYPWLLEAENQLKETPLIRASLRDQTEVVDFLCTNQSADASHRGNLGRTALLSAVSVPNAPANALLLLVRVLLENCGSDPFIRDFDRGSTAIHLAAEFNKVGVVEYLLAAYPTLLEVKNAANETALCRAAQNGNFETVKFLTLNASADVEARCYLDRTPLMYAATKGELKTVQFLVEKVNASINATDSPRGNMAIHLAANFGFVQVVDYLLNKSATLLEARTFINDTVLNSAASGGQVGVIDYLITNRSANIENRGFHGTTPFLRAVGNGKVFAAQFLAERGANVSAKTDVEWDEENAAHLAATYNLAVVARYLRVRFPDLLSVKNRQGLTPFDVAKANNNTEVARIFEQNGPKISTTRQPSTPPFG